MTIPCREDFIGIPISVDQEEWTISPELGQVLGQVSVQVQEVVNQSDIKDKSQLGLVLEQMFVQVWSKLKGTPDVVMLTVTTVDMICLLSDNELSAAALNSSLGYRTLYELKRRIINPLIKFGYIAMTNPDKPTSSKQEYKLTEKGRMLFKS